MFLLRRKTVKTNLDTQLSRCLSTREVLVLAVGHMVGGGIYALTGEIAKDVAGPGVVVSYLVAGMAACLSAMCYAEFGCRVPKAGSAYNYVYSALGEGLAFFVGWSLILEHVIGIAAVARTWSGYVNSLSDGRIHTGLESCCHMGNSSVFSSIPDFPAFLIVLSIGSVTALGAKVSVNITNGLTAINLLMVVIVSGTTFSKADVKNWTKNGGRSFSPYGVGGIMAGASRCFFSFIGFDTIATAAEEMKDPLKTIPRATYGSLLITSVVYMVMSSALTLAVPYTEIDPVAGFATMWSGGKLSWLKYFPIVGAIVATSTGMAGHLFALPRCVFAMAEDGLLPSCLAKIWTVTKVPTLTILGLSSAAGVVAMFVNLGTLVELLAVGTLMAYSMVSIAVLTLRYEDLGVESTRLSKVITSLLVAEALCIIADLAFRDFFMLREDWLFFVTAGMCYLTFVILIVIFIGTIRRNKLDYPYEVPAFPYIPIASTFVNVVLLAHLPMATWLRLAVWITIGCAVYFGFSRINSIEAKTGDAKKFDD